MADLACSSAVGQKFSDLYWVLLQLTKQPLFFFLLLTQFKPKNGLLWKAGRSAERVVATSE
jgi:hypothetical protein